MAKLIRITIEDDYKVFTNCDMAPEFEQIMGEVSKLKYTGAVPLMVNLGRVKIELQPGAKLQIQETVTDINEVIGVCKQ